MSAAISLRAHGYDVTVFEKNERPGGKLNVMEKDGFTFDLGPSIFTLPEYFEALFARAGKKMEDYLQLQSVTPHWRNFFEDGLVLDLYEEDEKMRRELDKLPGEGEAHWRELQAFLDYARGQYQFVERGYFAKGLDTLWSFLKFYHVDLLTGKNDYRTTMADAIASRLTDPKLRLIFEYFIKYVGSSALKAPGYMNLMPIIQFDKGLWYVKDGMYHLASGLARLMDEMGIRLELGTEIRALTREGKKVTGVEMADGSQEAFDIVVSNMEAIPTYRHLLKEPAKRLQKLEKFAPACSGIVLHLGTDRVFPQLAHHNFFYSEDQHKHFRTVFEKHRIPDDPTLYVVAPTRTDPSKAPEGCDNIKILPHIPPLQDDHEVSHDEYVALKERCLDKMERCGLEGLRESIITEDLLTPVDIERMYRSNQGSIYGVVTDWEKNRGFKAPTRSQFYQNLYFAGGSANPGGGMPMVILSGQNCADRVQRDFPLRS